MSELVSGLSVFSSITKHDEYMGESTGKFNLTVTLDAEDASKLEDLGVRLKEYEGSMQRKFSSKFEFKVVDMDDNPYVGEIPRGSEVRVAFSLGDVSPQWGPATHLEAVRVVSEGERKSSIPDEF